MYFKAVTEGLSPIPEIDETVREELNEDLKEKGLSHLYNELKSQDIKAYELIEKNDQQRILRALEVYRGSGKKYLLIGEWKDQRFLIIISLKSN